ncbi:MAG TPA: hypothetical protein VF050_06265 [Moraxellaceae bacterium]
MHVFKQGILASALALTLAPAAWADATTPASTDNTATPTAAEAQAEEARITPRLEDSARLLHLVATGGLSYGGDTVATIKYSNGDEEDLKAGGLIYFAGGLGLDIPNIPVTVQFTAGYQFNESTADNGEATFDRNTLEAQLFYRQGNHRFGVGAVQHNAPEFLGKIDGQPDVRVEFEDATGLSLEYDYLPVSLKFPFKDSRVGFSLRYVSIDYEAKSLNGSPVQPKTISGNHVAAGLYLYL